MNLRNVLLALLVAFGALTAFAQEKSLFEKVSQKTEKVEKGQKIAFLAGGSCDSGKKNFITEFNAWNAFLKDKKWKVRGFIDTSKQTEVSDARPFVWKDFLQAVEEVSPKETKQVLILFITHGEYEQERHTVCAEDGGAGIYHPVEELRPALDRLTQGGVQTAVIDMSCYSAYSVDELQGAASCVMSMAGKQTGSGAVTSPVAKNLAALPTVGKRASVEDVWLNTINTSPKQIPLISAYPFGFEVRVNKSIPLLSKGIGGRIIRNESVWEELIFDRENLPVWQKFYDENTGLFQHVFSPEACQGIEEFLSSGKSWKQGALGALMYLQARPERKDRPCANFYF